MGFGMTLESLGQKKAWYGIEHQKDQKSETMNGFGSNGQLLKVIRIRILTLDKLNFILYW